MITCQMLSSSAGVSFPIEVMYRFWRAMSVCSAWEKFKQYFRHQSSLHIVKFYWVDYSFKTFISITFAYCVWASTRASVVWERYVLALSVTRQEARRIRDSCERFSTCWGEKGCVLITLAIMVKNKIGKYFFNFCKWLELLLFNELEMYSVTSSETNYSSEPILFSESTTHKTEPEQLLN